MKKSLLAVFLLTPSLGLFAAPQQQSDHVPGRLLVQTTIGANPATVAQAVGRFGGKVQKTIPQIRLSVLEVPEAAIDQVSAALSRTGLFTFIERDYTARGTAVDPNDPDFPSQWHLTQIQGPNAWAVTTGSSTVTIAVIDSGADWTHPDLASKLVPGWNFLTGTSNTQDSGGDSGHGTAVSGAAAAATNNGTGVSGVAWSNMIMPLEVLDSTGSASYSNLVSAITYAADHGVRIINISLCGSSASSSLQSAVDYAWNKGVTIFAAAGNNSNSSPIYPAACNNVVSVSATDVNDTFASFSSYGSSIDISAPGNSILTTYLGGGYAYWYGTSFSSPITAGVAGLVLSIKPSLSNSALVSLLEQNSDDLGTSGWDQYFGYGRVNAYKAVLAAQSGGGDTTPPSVSISSPGNGATVSGTIQVQGISTDNVGVTNVQFYVDGQLVTSTTNASFSFSWNTTSAANVSHTLVVNAYDAAGNVGSASVTVTVSNTVISDAQAPTVAITSPANGSTVKGNVSINVSATDNVAVAQVSIYIDGILKCTDTVAPYTCSWNTKKTSSGSHTIKATAWDTTGNSSSATITVTK